MKDFKYWDNLHRTEQLEEFSTDRVGLLWLKLKSIIRVELVKGFLDFSDIEINTNKQSENFLVLFNLLTSDIEKSHKLLDTYIKQVSNEQIKKINISQLVSELYKLKIFEWGGDYQNSLDEYLVSRYVKSENPSYDYLLSKFETEINPAVQGYVLNSWYNYWSSVLIENIFKSHPAVLQTLKSEKVEILREVQANPKLLTKWLYENQGEMRFGSENRLYLVLVDMDDFNNSWKLKRNIDLLKPTIENYLCNFNAKNIDDLQVSFEFKGKPHGFTALADVIFVVK